MSLITRQITRFQRSGKTFAADDEPFEDTLLIEEPLEIELHFTFLSRPARRSIAITMRTPGDDAALARGFLFGEDLLQSEEDLAELSPDPEESNRIQVHLHPHVAVEMPRLQRNFYTTSSCGVCGKASLEALKTTGCEPLKQDLSITPDLLARLPSTLRNAQTLFQETGGSHGAGLFDLQGTLLGCYEDVGRHNAMDKLVGAHLIPAGPDTPFPGADKVVLWSGRASFELVQKALRARIALVVAIGAPSSLAVDLAREFGITLVGFTRQDRFNCYTHPHRIRS